MLLHKIKIYFIRKLYNDIKILFFVEIQRNEFTKLIALEESGV